MRRWDKNLIAVFFFALPLFLPSGAWGIITLRDDLELEGFVQSQFILRTPRYRDAELILQRNTTQLELTSRFVQDGRTTVGDFPLGPIEEVTFKLIYRFAYDSVYDLRESFRDNFSADERDTLKFENWIREAYVELLMPPLTLRLGRQQVVWGETDTFRALDVINPLDAEWHWAREPWEDIRIPLWMARGIYDIGKLGWLEESFVEGIWIPGDFQRNRFCGDPHRPWCFYGGRRRQPANSVIFADGQIADLVTLVDDQKPDRALESSEMGVRFKAVWGQVDFGLHYFWTLSDTTGVKVRNDLVTFDPTVGNGGTLAVPVDLVNPRSHVIGVAANYAEEYLTQTVFRVEATYTTGIPITLGTLDPLGIPERLDRDHNQLVTSEQTLFMLAFDRPTWVRPLNKLRTFFVTGQFFWQRYTDFNRFFRGTSSVRRALDSETGEVSPGRFVSVNTDRLAEDQVVATVAASTSYGPGGLIQPLVATAYNPLDTTFFHRFSVDYLYSNHLIFRLSHDFYWGKSTEEPWFIGGRFGGARDNRIETVFTIIFQF
jgi:hypothetical protein